MVGFIFIPPLWSVLSDFGIIKYLGRTCYRQTVSPPLWLVLLIGIINSCNKLSGYKKGQFINYYKSEIYKYFKD